MEKRGEPLLHATLLTLVPVVTIFPVVSLCHFSQTGPATVWPIILCAPVAMWAETRAIRLLLNMFRDGRDPFLLAILPLGLVALFVYALHGFVFILGLPGLLKHFL